MVNDLRTPFPPAEKELRAATQIDRLPVATHERAPVASVIIVNHNRRSLIEKCLRSLLNEDRLEYEIILVDNASTDESASFVEQVFPEVLVIRNQVNRGFGMGNNLGARWANGDYLAFLNPDTVVEPGWLKALIAALEADPLAGLATPKIMLLDDPERINTCGNEMHFTGLTLCRGTGKDRTTFNALEEVNAISGAAFIIRRDLFEALDGFDGSFFLYMEDTDISWRARLTGFKCIYVPSSVVYHAYTLRFGPSKTYYQERNRYLMLLKNLHVLSLLVMLPALLLSEIVTWGFVLVRGPLRLGDKIRAYGWILKHLNHIIENRRQVQALRTVRDQELLAKSTHRLAFEQTGDDPISRIAHLLFDPLFSVLQQLALFLIRW